MMRRVTTRFNGAGCRKFSATLNTTHRVATTPATTTTSTTCTPPTKSDAHFIWKAYTEEMARLDQKEQDMARGMMTEPPPAHHPAATSTVSHTQLGVAVGTVVSVVACGFLYLHGVMTYNNEASVIRFELLDDKMALNDQATTERMNGLDDKVNDVDDKVAKESDARKEETHQIKQTFKTSNEQLKNLVKDEAKSRKKGETKIADDLSKLSAEQQSNKNANEYLNKKLNKEVASRESSEKKLASDLSKLTQEQRSTNDANNSERMMLVPWDLRKKEGWSEPFSLWGHTWKLGMKQDGPTTWKLILTAADDSKWAAPVTFNIKKANRETKTFEDQDDLASKFNWGITCEGIPSEEYDAYAHDGRLAVHIEMFSPPRFEAS